MFNFQLSRCRDLNSGPLPYQGSALPLSYNSKENKSCGQRWIRTTEGVSQQIYSLPHLATLVFALLLLRTTLNLSLSSFVSQLRCKGTTIFVNSKQNLSFLLQ